MTNLGLKGGEKPAGGGLGAELMADPAMAQQTLGFAFLVSLGLPLPLAGYRRDYHLRPGNKQKKGHWVLSSEFIIIDSCSKASMSSASGNME